MGAPSYTVYAIQYKTVDADQRIIEGIASTPAPDRLGDVMIPAGARFTLPMPLLWQHDLNKPIGQVLSATVTAAGIKIRAQIAKGIQFIEDQAWPMIKAGLVPGLSIGYKPIEAEPIKGTYGLTVKTWDWFETSTVTVPANVKTTITAIKSADQAIRAESGRPPVPSAVAGSARKDHAMTYSERIAGLEAERSQKRTSLEALLEKDTLTDEERTERDSLTTELEGIGATVKSYRALEASQALEAAPVAPRAWGGTSAPAGSSNPITVEEPKLKPGIAFAQVMLCKCASQFAVMQGNGLSAVQVAKQWYPHRPSVQMAVKAAVAPALTSDATWAGTLVYAQTIADFVEYLRPKTVIGQFGTGNIPSLNRVPFNMRQVKETAAMTGYWVGEAKPKPVTLGGYSTNTLGFAKVAAITIDSEELLRFSNHPTISAEEAMRNGLTRALVAKIDTSLIDPSFAAVANVNPASLTNGLSLGSSAGNTADDVRADVLALLAGVGAIGLGTTDNIDPRGVVLVMPPGVALAASLMRTTVGGTEFPDITINGGSLQGIPVLVSNYAAIAGYGNLVIAIVAPEINLADDGGVTVDMSREASLEMSSTPTQSGTTGVSLVSLWQDNLVAFRAERFINWGLRRPGVVAAIQSVNWGGVASPS
jgi:HK97 family phage prohead protease/HK97 family phage major capsid protein